MTGPAMSMDQLVGKLNRISQSVPSAIFAGADKGMIRMVARAQDNCNPATSPYSPPPFQKGDMMRSIGSKVAQNGVTVTCVLFAGVDYAKRIHEGAGSMAGRPYLYDAVKSEEKALLGDVQEAVTIVFRRECV